MSQDEGAVPVGSPAIWPIVGALWFGLAVAVGAGRIYDRLPPAALPGTVVGATLGLVGGYLVSSRFQRWVVSLPVEGLIAIHLTRYVGIAFLMLQAQGELPSAFAVPAGIGDIAIALGATLFLLVGSRATGGIPLRWLNLWNIAGLADILFVVVRAARLNLGTPGSMQALLRLPLSLLPTMIVPLIIGSHLELLRRQRAGSRYPIS